MASPLASLLVTSRPPGIDAYMTVQQLEQQRQEQINISRQQTQLQIQQLQEQQRAAQAAANAGVQAASAQSQGAQTQLEFQRAQANMAADQSRFGVMQQQYADTMNNLQTRDNALNQRFGVRQNATGMRMNAVNEASGVNTQLLGAEQQLGQALQSGMDARQLRRLVETSALGTQQNTATSLAQQEASLLGEQTAMVEQLLASGVAQDAETAQMIAAQRIANNLTRVGNIDYRTQIASAGLSQEYANLLAQAGLTNINLQEQMNNASTNAAIAAQQQAASAAQAAARAQRPGSINGQVDALNDAQRYNEQTINNQYQQTGQSVQPLSREQQLIADGFTHNPNGSFTRGGLTVTPSTSGRSGSSGSVPVSNPFYNPTSSKGFISTGYAPQTIKSPSGLLTSQTINKTKGG